MTVVSCILAPGDCPPLIFSHAQSQLDSGVFLIAILDSLGHSCWLTVPWSLVLGICGFFTIMKLVRLLDFLVFSSPCTYFVLLLADNITVFYVKKRGWGWSVFTLSFLVPETDFRGFVSLVVQDLHFRPRDLPWKFFQSVVFELARTDSTEWSLYDFHLMLIPVRLPYLHYEIFLVFLSLCSDCTGCKAWL